MCAMAEFKKQENSKLTDYSRYHVYLTPVIGEQLVCKREIQEIDMQ